MVWVLVVFGAACGADDTAGPPAAAARANRALTRPAPVSLSTSSSPAAVAVALPTPPGEGAVARPNPVARPRPRPALPFLEIPRIGLLAHLNEGDSPEVLAKGPTRHTSTARPGEMGNVVVAGHRTTHGRPFLDIDRLGPGDEIIVVTASGRFVYRTMEQRIVPAERFFVTRTSPDARLTLYACHPKGSSRERLAVVARLVSPPVPLASPAGDGRVAPGGGGKDGGGEDGGGPGVPSPPPAPPRPPAEPPCLALLPGDPCRPPS